MAKYFERKAYKNSRFAGVCGDGSVMVEVDFTHILEIKPLIYEFIPYIKVIEPTWLQNTIKDEIKSYLDEIK